MKKYALVFLFPFLIGGADFANAMPNYKDGRYENYKQDRQEFEELFSNIKICEVIKKYLPHEYEKLFQSFLSAKNNKEKDFQISNYINSIRNEHLKKSSDKSIFKFFSHIVNTGRNIFVEDPDAAFSYLFGGDPASYAEFINMDTEMEKVGELFHQLLSSSSPDNMGSVDQEEVENGMNFVFLMLHYKHGESLSLLNKEYVRLNSEERHHLCNIYLDMYEEVLNLAPSTRNNVLRSFAMRM
jgi:hypothetical protein